MGPMTRDSRSVSPPSSARHRRTRSQVWRTPAVIVVAVACPQRRESSPLELSGTRCSPGPELAGATLEVVEHGDELTTTGAAGTWVGRIGTLPRRSDASIDVARASESSKGFAALAAPVLPRRSWWVDRWIGGTVDGAVARGCRPRAVRDRGVCCPARRRAAGVGAGRRRATADRPRRTGPGHRTGRPRGACDAPTARARRRHAPLARRGFAGVERSDGLEPDTLARIDGAQRHRQVDLAAALVRFIGVDEGRYLLGDVDTTQAGGDKHPGGRHLVPADTVARSELRCRTSTSPPRRHRRRCGRHPTPCSFRTGPSPFRRAVERGRPGRQRDERRTASTACPRPECSRRPPDRRARRTDGTPDAPTAERVLRDLLVALEGRTVLLLGHGTAPRYRTLKWTRRGSWRRRRQVDQADLTAFSTR